MCTGEPKVGNATAELLSMLWTVGTAAEVICKSGYKFEAEASDRANVHCTATGWENRQGCVKGEDLCIMCIRLDKLSYFQYTVAALKIMLLRNM